MTCEDVEQGEGPAARRWRRRQVRGGIHAGHSSRTSALLARWSHRGHLRRRRADGRATTADTGLAAGLLRLRGGDRPGPALARRSRTPDPRSELAPPPRAVADRARV